MPTLVAAEADRIQDLIFRSSRLREITGGSFALEEFWKGVANAAKHRGARVRVSAGGAFRAFFDDGTGDPSRFARDLQDAYARHVGGTLTAVVVAGDGKGELLKKAPAKLAREKLRGDPPAASVHLPYLQPCDSCARDLAAGRFSPRGREDEGREEEKQDLCRICAARRRERDEFEETFLKQVQNAAEKGLAVEGLAGLPEDANQVGSLDGRARVAYLLADGNGFGRFFREAAEHDDKKDEDVYGNLSATVVAAGAQALVTATAKVPPLPDGRAPVLPLITGGDDIFALLPAPWAFDFAREFAETFVERMREATLFSVRTDLKPSISCALVFCKATFPYRFAHEAGEEALKQAKRASRDHQGVSVVRGVELRATAGGATGLSREYGVFALDVPDAPQPPLLPVSTLLSVRGALQPRLAGKRRHQIEALYAAGDYGSAAWQGRRARVFERMDGGDAARGELEKLVDGERDAAVDLFHLWDYLGRLTPATAEASR